MTRSTVKKLKEPLEEHERELHGHRRVTSHQQQNDSLTIAGRNLLDDEASSPANSGPKPTPPLKSLREHSFPNSVGFQNLIVLLVKEARSIVDSRYIWLIQGILSTFKKCRTPKPNASTCAITTRLGAATREPLYPTPSNLETINNTDGTIKEKGLEGEETTTVHNKETLQSPTLYHPSKSSSVPFPSRLKKQKKDNDDERVLSIFRQSTILRGHDPYAKGGQQMDEDKLVPIITGRPFLAIVCAVIDVHEGKLSLRVRKETVTFNIGKSIRSAYYRDDYLYCADHTAKLIRER
nr:hypothetical protein [Tanacetum cinerariifolium]